MMDYAVEIFKVKRNWMRRLLDNGRIPFATQRPRDPNNPTILAPTTIDLDSYVYTIGVVGLDDMVKFETGHRMYEDRESLEFGLNIIMKMKSYAMYLSDLHGIPIALARTPAETTN